MFLCDGKRNQADGARPENGDGLVFLYMGQRNRVAGDAHGFKQGGFVETQGVGEF